MACFPNPNLSLEDVASSRDFLNLARGFSDFPGTSLLYSGRGEGEGFYSFLGLFPQKVVRINLGDKENPWDCLEQELTLDPRLGDLPQWIGYLSYEMGAFVESDYAVPFEEPSIPLAEFYQAQVLLVYDHAQNETSVFFLCESPDKEWLDPLWWTSQMASNIDLPSQSAENVLWTDDLSTYTSKVKAIQEHIRAGTVYQGLFISYVDYGEPI